MKIKERNKKFYSLEGLEALKTRFKSLVEIHNKKEFPFKAHILGFQKTEIKNKKECQQKIIELSELIGMPLEMKVSTEKKGKEEIIKEEIMYSEKWQ